MRKLKNVLGVGILGACIIFTTIALIIFLYSIFSKGLSSISWTFLTQPPRDAMTSGGIYPAILGTLYLTLLSISIALPLGIFTAIYLNNYGKPRLLMQIVRISINTLAGIPSIIYGLFGMAVFVNLMKFDVSLIAGAFTLAILALPIIINASEEAMRGVPRDFIDASMALGATERQTILRIILPTALPNILTGAIISVGRVAGETAPIMFTAATFYSRQLPKSIFHEVMALPYHIFALMTEGSNSKLQTPIAYGSAVVLLILVLGVSSLAIAIRYHIRRKRKW
ncbi:MAG: phosphate ABC transporter permease PstA [Candidatus Cloacimonadaceae bacterium]|nr:phosphate ABC transporter permease PstA [Candidatus Cloacimonadaceae bacterium]MDP3114991.1 phosphate ABC transporter permease PstA [Candidatus Cloacimonadaceae bacterium]